MTWITPQIATPGEHKNPHRCSESVTVSFSFSIPEETGILLLVLS
jgi:hypothetical protein